MAKLSVTKAFQILGAQEGDSYNKLKRAFRKAAFNAHPDKEGDTVSMSLINDAWSIVKEHVPTEVVEQVDVLTLDPQHTCNFPSLDSKQTLISSAWRIVNSISDVVVKYKDDTQYDDPWLFHSVSDKSVYIKDSMLHFSAMHTGSMYLTDVTNAMRTGKTCRKYTIQFDVMDNDFHNFFSLFTEQYNINNPVELFKFLETQLEDKWEINQYCDTSASCSLDEFKMNIYRNDEKSSTVFSPLSFDVIKPIKSIPKKWTISHLKKLVINGQFSHCKQNFYYTDDYAMDSAMGYRRGYINNPLSMIEDDWDFNGFRVWESFNDGKTITLNFGCHSNDSRSLTVNLDNRYSVVDLHEDGQTLIGCDSSNSQIGDNTISANDALNSMADNLFALP